MANASNEFEVIILEHLINRTAWTQPTSLWIALGTSSWSDDSSGFTESLYTGYARVQMNESDWSTVTVPGGPVGSTVDNATAITFPQCTGGTETLRSFAVFNVSTLGDAWIVGALSSTLDVSVNVTPEFAIGNLVISCN